MITEHTFFAPTAKGMASLLIDELRELGIEQLKEAPAGVAFTGSLDQAYRACLWSRIANRVLLKLKDFHAPTPEALYAGIQEINWAEHMDVQQTLAVDFTTIRSKINHSHFGALKVKDAVVDQFREACGERPSVEREHPDLRINLFLDRDQAHVSLDLSGDSLHRRGYRVEAMGAPLKENLAASILLRGRWPEVASAGGALVDPMCGSGTLLIEGAMMAGDIAPGLGRDYYGFLGWKGHDDASWQALLKEAEQRKVVGLENMPVIHGYDSGHKAMTAARDNVESAGLDEYIVIARRTLEELKCPAACTTGLVVANPPYGERLGDMDKLPTLYGQLGDTFKQEFKGWKAAVFTGNPELGKHMGLKAKKMYKLFNGNIECKLLQFDVEEQWFIDRQSKPYIPGEVRLDAGAEMFKNRLCKNLKTMRKWAKKEGIDCYRLYDADMPEYALAIDIYQGEERWVHVQEYAAPDTVDAKKAESRLQQALAVIPDVLDIPKENLFFKIRKKQKGKEQYEKQEEVGEFYEVKENGCQFWVNFSYYLDSGLFLDHRITRAMLGELAKGKSFLNLFAYTGSATVYAAKAGATSTTTVDMSYSYLDWAESNMELNGFKKGPQHEFIQANCLKWLDEQAGQRQFDLIFLDPPTFSTSKRMEGTFDVQRDHVALLFSTLKLLAPGGTLIFSNNKRKFKMELPHLDGLTVDDISKQTIPKDFERNARIHNCWKITKAKN